MQRAFVFLTAMMLLANSAAWADNTLTPQQIVKKFYDPFLADPHADSPETGPDSLEAIFPYASESLQTAINKEKTCQMREQGICNLDFDVIINAQDWFITNFTMEESSPHKDHLVVRAKFTNGDRNMVSYLFIREDGDWKIDDVQSAKFRDNGKVYDRYRLKEALMAD